MGMDGHLGYRDGGGDADGYDDGVDRGKRQESHATYVSDIPDPGDIKAQEEWPQEMAIPAEIPTPWCPRWPIEKKVKSLKLDDVH